MIDFALPAEVAELATAAATFARDVLTPGARAAEQQRSWGDRADDGFSELGIAGLMLPAVLGGADAPLAAVVALETLAGGDAGGLLLADQPGPGCGVLRALPDWDLAASLADAAADGGVLTLAVADSINDPAFTVPYAPGTPESGCPHALLVAAADGIAVAPATSMHVTAARAGAFDASGGIEVRAQGSALQRFPLDLDDAHLARAFARLWAGAILTGIAQAALDHAIAYGRERVVFGLPVVAHQYNAFTIAAHATAIDAGRVALRTAAHLVEAQEPAAAWSASAAYLEARAAALAATDDALLLLGGHGYMRDHPVEKWWREARVLALLFGGEDAAVDDLASGVLSTPDALGVT